MTKKKAKPDSNKVKALKGCPMKKGYCDGCKDFEEDIVNGAYFCNSLEWDKENKG